ncbi:hypothetical protein M441DRAFT_120429, partial [Trichoderma asperellum CBS 433.97]
GDQEGVKLLLEKGVDINHGGHFGSALAVASFSGHQKIVQLLLDNGAVVNDSKYGYCFALVCASLKGHENIVRLLLKTGAVMDAKELA